VIMYGTGKTESKRGTERPLFHPEHETRFYVYVLAADMAACAAAGAQKVCTTAACLKKEAMPASEEPPEAFLVDISRLWPDDAEAGRCEEGIADEEIQWMLSRRPLDHSKVTRERLALDYNEHEARAMLGAFAESKVSHLIPVLRWPGVGTRWREFIKWVTGLPEPPSSPELAFAGFARALGRVTTYRALSLDAAGLRRIIQAKEIFPRGQLEVSADELSRVIEEHGVVKVVVARLYIAHLKRLIGHDPSVSLHDDWQTTSCIASGYTEKEKSVYLFEVSVPIVESLGLRLSEVEVNAPPFLGPRYGPSGEGWFCFAAPAFPDGVHFDRTVQETERYGLYSVPFLHRRLRRLWRYPSVADIGLAISPFAERQAALQKRHPKGCGLPPYSG
ncbi:unnamed protein product, partial [Symbiodinium microadriaticum]